MAPSRPHYVESVRSAKELGEEGSSLCGAALLAQDRQVFLSSPQFWKRW